MIIKQNQIKYLEFKKKLNKNKGDKYKKLILTNFLIIGII